MVVFIDFDTPTPHLLSAEAAIRANIVLYPVDARGLVFRRVEENSRGVYVLWYDLTAAMADGRFHRVEVKVSRQRLKVRGKEGYFAPQR